MRTHADEEQLEQELRTHLQRHAGLVPGNLGGYGKVMRRRRASQQRRIAGMAVGAVAVLAVGGTLAPSVPGLVDRLQPAQTVQVVTSDPLTWPTRGSLAGDRAFLAKASTFFRIRNGATPGQVKFLYAGDIADSRIVAAVARDAIWVLEAPRGAESGFNGSEGPWRDEKGQWTNNGLLAIAIPDSDGTTVIAMGGDIDRVELSPRQEIDASGQVTRDWGALTERKGVYTTHVDGSGVPQMRARAIKDGKVVADDYLVTSRDRNITEPKASARLRSLVEGAARAHGEQPTPRLADALADLEHDVLGIDAITSVDALWQLRDEAGNWWAGVVVRTSYGAAVEGIFRYRDGESLQPRSMFDAWPVAVDRAGTSPMFWNPPCEVGGYLPEAIGPVTSVELVLAGDVQPRDPVTGRLFSKRICSTVAELDRLADRVEVRLYDANGKRVWSGKPEGGYDVYGRLDAPITRGQKVD
ncbi:hypothetical protein [Actinopolymorpha alba]|uniref:hypothetical protein n=1 Tax=Actinopolymorpha alba TaxID=533267 RepID=UPI00038070D7|nr:hypothetical protein [Actinopolymorpha alba]